MAKDVEAHEPDTLIYLVNTPFTSDSRVTSSPPLSAGTIVFFEMYRTVEAYLRHVNGPIFQNFLSNSGGLFIAQNGVPITVVSLLTKQAGFIRGEPRPATGVDVDKHPSVAMKLP